jgi:hypothetical protein
LIGRGILFGPDSFKCVLLSLKLSDASRQESNVAHVTGLRNPDHILSLSASSPTPFPVTVVRSLVRPRLLSHHAHNMLTQFIQQGFDDHRPVPNSYLIDQPQKSFDVCVLQHTMHHIICVLRGVKVVTEVPMNQARVTADPFSIDAHYE